ncbi:/ / hypothetical protein / 481265:481504 Reverse [Candidatus Hepatoplasma crinochetorum]|uniref:Uncharacterized protein n=1 Tax=Candidatus Hepatoplasma crinochetorum TaxID=295596 RepID=A0A0G7ZLD4_9MOLU|nr:/ / hypothetical protein / 481265:481504 Reverse [Candidatus Hepatoplasma crinochetorum]
MAWEITAIVFICLLPITIFFTFYFTKKLIERQIKKNPPISEQQIRAMFQSMGRKPSEAQIRNTMNALKGKNRQTYKKRK